MTRRPVTVPVDACRQVEGVVDVREHLSYQRDDRHAVTPTSR